MAEKEMISDYSEKKVSDYIKELEKTKPPGERSVLLRFGHGLGDTLLFMPAFWRLRELYPTTRIDLYIESGQEEIFHSVPVEKATDFDGYDHIFILHFPMSEGSSFTKSQKCCMDELGIDPITDVASIPKKPSPFVALHFQGTALPDNVGCPEDVARLIWEDVIAAGKIPIECHYEHLFHNPVNEKFPFITNTARGCSASLHSLFGLLQHCCAFIGVASGPFVAALSWMPTRMMYIERDHRLETYTYRAIPRIKLYEGYRPGHVKEWLETLDRR